MTTKHLVTGATGNIGALVTHRLIERGIRPCIIVRDEARARALFGDAVDIRVGDLGASQRSLAAAFAGWTRSFFSTAAPTLPPAIAWQRLRPEKPASIDMLLNFLERVLALCIAAVVFTESRSQETAYFSYRVPTHGFMLPWIERFQLLMGQRRFQRTLDGAYHQIEIILREIHSNEEPVESIALRA